MDGLAQWTATASVRIGVNVAERDRVVALDLAREVRDASSRSAALLAVYLLGVAVGSGKSAARVAAELTDHARQWSGDTCDWRD